MLTDYKNKWKTTQLLHRDSQKEMQTEYKKKVDITKREQGELQLFVYYVQTNLHYIFNRMSRSNQVEHFKDQSCSRLHILCQ